MNINIDIELDLDELLILCDTSDMIKLDYVRPELIIDHITENNLTSFEIFEKIYNLITNKLDGCDKIGKRRNNGVKLLESLMELVKNDIYKDYNNIYNICNFIIDLTYLGNIDTLFPRYRNTEFIKDLEIRKFIINKLIINNDMDNHDENILTLQLLVNVDFVPTKRFRITDLYLLRSCIYNINEICKNKTLNSIETKYIEANLNYFIQSFNMSTFKRDKELVSLVLDNRENIIKYVDNHISELDTTSLKVYNSFKDNTLYTY